jgi:magnesium-transporting ATPase (P-type)
LNFLYYASLALLGISALGIAHEDFRWREVSLAWFGLFGLGTLLHALQHDTTWHLTNSLVNVIIMLITWFSLYLYIAFKLNRLPSFNTIQSSYIGLGDIIMWPMLCFIFPSWAFMVFSIACPLVAIMLHLALSKYFKDIPLAGIWGLGLIVAFVVGQCL